jgi:hypothetical protein
MAEFSNTGFSAVNDFFGESTQEKNSVAPQQAQQPKTKRRGVGSTLAPKTQNQDLISKRVLKVGSKRNRDDDDDEEDVTAKEDDDDEEDAGRTAITPKERAVNVNAPEKEQVKVVANKEGGSKKLGKKERERVKKEAEETAAAGTETKNEDMEDTGVAEEEEDDNNKKGGQKKKRRKIRSKQKNVYKDSRSLEEKPKHLVPGKRLYQGRPLTSETRTKLGLPPPKPRQYEAPAPINTSDKGIKLAVEDLLDDAKPSQKASKKKKRPKYKNLRI